jgi:hypothetical protein
MKTALGVTVIENGQLVDGTGTPPIRDAALVSIARQLGLMPGAARSCRDW